MVDSLLVLGGKELHIPKPGLEKNIEGILWLTLSEKFEHTLGIFDNKSVDENDGGVAGEDSSSRGAMIAYNNTSTLPASEMMDVTM